MINKELELTINQQNILENLARNLNISSVTDNTSIKKIADTFEAELRNYSDATEIAIRNGFLSTMDDSLFEQFASDFGIYRKRYSKIKINKEDQAVGIAVNTQMLFTKNLINFTPFRKGDTLYSNSTINIKALEDITFQNTDGTYIYRDLEITLKSGEEEYFIIPYEAEYLLTPKQEDLIPHTPSYKLLFNSSIGLTRLEESMDDFRLRVYEATYLASNSANSLLTAVTKDVPLLYHVETDNIEVGRSIDVIYPYTYSLIMNGFDNDLSTLVIPMIETSLSNKSYYQNMVKVKQPKSFNLAVRVKYGNQPAPTYSVVDIMCSDFNTNYYTTKSITVSKIKDIILDALFRYKLTREDISLYFISTDISTEGMELPDTETITLGLGRFLYLSAIEEDTNNG